MAVLLGHRRRLGLVERGALDVGPQEPEVRSVDPAGQGPDLAVAQRLAHARRRHLARGQLADQDALDGTEVGDHGTAFASLQHRLHRAQVEPPHGLVRGVTGEATALENGKRQLVEPRGLLFPLGGDGRFLIRGGARLDPAPDRVDLRVGQLQVERGRRHQPLRDLPVEQAFFGRVPHHHRSLVAAAQNRGGGAQIQADHGGAAVATVAIGLEDGLHVPLEAGLCECAGRRRQRGQNRKRDQQTRKPHVQASRGGFSRMSETMRAPVMLALVGVSCRPSWTTVSRLWSIPS